MGKSHGSASGEHKLSPHSCFHEREKLMAHPCRNGFPVCSVAKEYTDDSSPMVLGPPCCQPGQSLSQVCHCQHEPVTCKIVQKHTMPCSLTCVSLGDPFCL